MRKSDMLGMRLWRAVATIRVVAALGVAVPLWPSRKALLPAPNQTLIQFSHTRRKTMTTRFAPLRGITLAVLLTLGVGQGLMFGDDVGDKPGDKPTCTLATLKGRYLFGGIATLLPPATPQATLLAVAGYHIFNGDGTGTDVVTSTINRRHP